MASSLLIRLGLDLGPLQESLNQAEKKLKRFSFRAERVGRDLTTRVSLPIIGIGAAAVSTFAKFDRMEKALSAVTGSAKLGSEQFDRLFSIVNDPKTTLDLKGAATAAIQLQAVGQSAQQTESLLKQLGIAATVSGSSAEDVGEVGRQLAQAAAKGKILQQELRIVLERIPGLAGVISKEFGTVTAEGLNDAGVSADQFLSRLTKAIEGNEQFQNVQISLAKSFESFSANAQKAAADLGETIAVSFNLQENLEKLSTLIGEATKRFVALSPETKKFITFAAAGIAAIGPFSLGLGALAKSLPLLKSGFSLLLAPLTGFSSIIAFITSPIGLAVAAIAALAAIVVIAYRNSATFREVVNQLGSVLSTLVSVVIETGKRLFETIDKALEPFGGALGVIGSIAKVVVGILTGLLAVIAKVVTILVEDFTKVFSGIGDILSGDVKAGFSKLADSLANPLNFGKIAEAGAEVGKAFRETFDETVSGLGSTQKPLQLFNKTPGVQESGNPDGNDEAAAGTGRATIAVQALNKSLNDLSNTYAIVSTAQLAAESTTARLAEQAGKLALSLDAGLLDGYAASIEVINNKNAVFGDGFDALGAKIDLTKGLITAVLEDGFTPYSNEVIFLQEQLDGLTSAQEGIKSATEASTEALKQQQEVVSLLSKVTGSAFDKVGSALKKGENDFKAFGSAVIGAVRDTISAEIKLAVTTAAASALKTVPFPFNVGLAAAAGAGASALFNGLLNSLKIPALADGGVTTGATLALIGEGRENEAVLPLSKLQGMLDTAAGGGGGGTVSFRIDGDDLYALWQRGEARFKRSV